MCALLFKQRDLVYFIVIAGSILEVQTDLEEHLNLLKRSSGEVNPLPLLDETYNGKKHNRSVTIGVWRNYIQRFYLFLLSQIKISLNFHNWSVRCWRNSRIACRYLRSSTLPSFHWCKKWASQRIWSSLFCFLLMSVEEYHDWWIQHPGTYRLLVMTSRYLSDTYSGISCCCCCCLSLIFLPTRYVFYKSSRSQHIFSTTWCCVGILSAKHPCGRDLATTDYGSGSLWR